MSLSTVGAVRRTFVTQKPVHERHGERCEGSIDFYVSREEEDICDRRVIGLWLITRRWTRAWEYPCAQTSDYDAVEAVMTEAW